MGEEKIKSLIRYLLLLFVMIAGLIAGGRLVIADDGDVNLSSVFSSASATGFGPRAYIPLVIRAYANIGPPLDPPIAHSGTPPIDFTSIQSNFRANGKDLAFNKIGFHLGPGGNPTGYVEWMNALDAAGIPFFVKSVDDAGRLEAAVDIAKNSNVPHTIIFRRSGIPEYDVPDYDKDPVSAAEEHWQKHLTAFDATGLDPDYVWLETINEVDKGRVDWLAQFATETAELALRDGYKWAAFGWSSGEPEPYHWETPSMLAFLRLAGQYPDQLAVALHEYSYVNDDLGFIYPWLVGRLQKLFEICDRNGIPRPTVLITEFGWTYNDLPSPEQAMEQLEWAAWFYSAYPTVKGAAIWYLGGWFNIENETQALISPLKDFTLANYYEYTPGNGSIDSDLFNPPPWTLDIMPHIGNQRGEESVLISNSNNDLD